MSGRRRARLILIGVAQVAVTLGILALIVVRWGPDPFLHALRTMPAWTWAGGLLLGASGVIAQALRWRIVARHQGIRVSIGSAIARCWQAAFVNSVLPGGLAGDALRAADDSSDARGQAGRRALGSGVAAVLSERLLGTAVVFAAATVALASRTPLAWASLAIAIAAVAVAWRWLRRLTWREVLATTVLSVAGWASFAGLFALVTVSLAPAVPPGLVPAVSAVAIAGMSVPVGVGGWGTREAAAGWVFALVGLDAGLGIAISIGYGVLALASTLPGAVVLALRAAPRVRAARLARARRRDEPPG